MNIFTYGQKYRNLQTKLQKLLDKIIDYADKFIDVDH